MSNQAAAQIGPHTGYWSVFPPWNEPVSGWPPTPIISYPSKQSHSLGSLHYHKVTIYSISEQSYVVTGTLVGYDDYGVMLNSVDGELRIFYPWSDIRYIETVPEEAEE